MMGGGAVIGGLILIGLMGLSYVVLVPFLLQLFLFRVAGEALPFWRVVGVGLVILVLHWGAGAIVGLALHPLHLGFTVTQLIVFALLLPLAGLALKYLVGVRFVQGMLIWLLTSVAATVILSLLVAGLFGLARLLG